MADYRIFKAMHNWTEYWMWNYDYNYTIKKMYHCWEEYCIPDKFDPVCFWYTWAEQCITLNPWKYCIEVRWAEWWKGASSCYANWPKWAYAAWTIKLTSQSTFYIYVWWKWCNTGSYGSHSVAWWWNWWWTWWWTNRDCANSWVWWWWWWTDVRYNWNTLYNRFIVAGWWAWGWAMRYYSDRPYTSNNWWGWGAQWYWAWPGTQTSAWRCWSFWQWANMSWWYNNSTAPWWWWWWYGWWWCFSVSNDWCAVACGSWWSSYTYTSDTCWNHPCKICLWDLPLMTNAVCCWCADTFPTADGWTETWHIGCWCVKISKA